MNFKIMFISMVSTVFMLGCFENSEGKFYIMQDGESFSGSEITIERETFSFMSNEKGYSLIISKEPIRDLEHNDVIVKATGTSGAWYPGNLPLYQSSDLITDETACDVYYGNQGEKCQIFVKEKIRLGFKDTYIYTFSEYFIDAKVKKITEIDNESIENLFSGRYYLYFFSFKDKMGEVARSQSITRMKINFR